MPFSAKMWITEGAVAIYIYIYIYVCVCVCVYLCVCVCVCALFFSCRPQRRMPFGEDEPPTKIVLVCLCTCVLVCLCACVLVCLCTCVFQLCVSVFMFLRFCVSVFCWFCASFLLCICASVLFCFCTPPQEDVLATLAAVKKSGAPADGAAYASIIRACQDDGPARIMALLHEAMPA